MQAGETFSKNRTASAMSCGRIICSAGTCCLANSVIGVSTKAGQSAVDLMPWGASSLFIASVQPTTPCLVAEYTDSQPWPYLPEIEEVLTTSAFLCSAAAV